MTQVAEYLKGMIVREGLKRGAPLNKPDFATLYTPGAKGYVDYPTLASAG